MVMSNYLLVVPDVTKVGGSKTQATVKSFARIVLKLSLDIALHLNITQCDFKENYRWYVHARAL